MLRLQAFDFRGDNAIPYQKLDYGRLVIGWAYSPPIRAAPIRCPPRRAYAENPDPVKARLMFDFIYAAFGADLNGRWSASRMRRCSPSTACTTWRRATLRRGIQRQTTDPTVPDWA
jgi:hypothetical protein